MTKREQLREQYEEALFALMMDEFSVSQGERFLEESERLNSDPDFEVPPELERRCLRAISRHFAREDLRRAGRVCSGVVRKIAVAALIGAVIFTTAFAVSDEFRANTLNAVVEVFEDRTEFSFAGLDVGGEYGEEEFPYEMSAGWIPEGYSLIKAKENRFTTRRYYQAENGDEFSIVAYAGEHTGLGIDTEDADVNSIGIQNAEGLLVRKGEIAQVVWPDEEKTVFVVITGPVDLAEDFVKVAQDVKIENR